MKSEYFVLVIIGLGMIPLTAYAFVISDNVIILKSYDKDNRPDCNRFNEGMIIYSKSNKNTLICTGDSWSLPDGSKLQ